MDRQTDGQAKQSEELKVRGAVLSQPSYHDIQSTNENGKQIERYVQTD